jgi:hypothetical protein
VDHIVLQTRLLQPVIKEIFAHQAALLKPNVLQEPIPLQWACHRACNAQVESIPIQQDRPHAWIAHHA